MATLKSYFLSFLFTLFALLPFSLAATATSFCKCTCFGNSTIIALTTPSSAAPKASAGTCTDCNRKFCLDYNLPICKAAQDADVLTTCFQRDSAKDEAVVFVFITATVGLLVYAGVRPWVEKWAETMRERRSYMPVTNQAGADES